MGENWFFFNRFIKNTYFQQEQNTPMRLHLLCELGIAFAIGQANGDFTDSLSSPAKLNEKILKWE